MPTVSYDGYRITKYKGNGGFGQIIQIKTTVKTIISYTEYSHIGWIGCMIFIGHVEYVECESSDGQICDKWVGAHRPEETTPAVSAETVFKW
jgi:hypothetical protein